MLTRREKTESALRGHSTATMALRCVDCLGYDFAMNAKPPFVYPGVEQTQRRAVTLLR
jgi:hypothetical protein